MIAIPLLGRLRKAEPQGLLAILPKLFSEFQANGVTVSNNKVDVPRNDNCGCPVDSTYKHTYGCASPIPVGRGHSFVF